MKEVDNPDSEEFAKRVKGERERGVLEILTD